MPRPGRIVVAGAGLAGLRAVEHLRRRGFDGRLTLIGREAHPPYDRPPLSKDMLWSDAAGPPRSLARDDLVRDLGVDFRPGTEVTGLDAARRRLTVHTGETFGYDSLIIATGALARDLAEGRRYPNVRTLRSYDDCMRLRAALRKHPRLVVAGAGFIGCEVATAAARAGLDVTVIEPLSVPLGRSLGALPGSRVAGLLEASGARLITGTGVAAVSGNARAEAVRLSDGRVLEADEVLVGLGATPDVDWLRDSGVGVGRGAICDEYGRSSAPGVWAAGDAAEYRHRGYGGHIIVEHWFNAHEQAAAVAANVLAGDGELTEYRPLPYFWSEQAGVRIQVLGRPEPTEEPQAVHVESPRPAVVYLYGEPERLTAAVSFGAPARLMKLRPLILRGASLAEAAALVRA